MKFLVVAAALVASASAFAPAATNTNIRSSAINGVDVSKEIGVQAPLGAFDPLGILGPDLTNVDAEKFDRWRWAELKHGRVAMVRR
jgi:hypothetical protein